MKDIEELELKDDYLTQCGRGISFHGGVNGEIGANEILEAGTGLLCSRCSSPFIRDNKIIGSGSYGFRVKQACPSINWGVQHDNLR